MFGLGTGELLFILLLVLLIYGPDRLPEMAKKLGKVSREIKQLGEGVRDTLEKETRKDGDKPS